MMKPVIAIVALLSLHFAFDASAEGISEILAVKHGHYICCSPKCYEQYVYFVGHKRLNSKYGRIRDQILRYDRSSDQIEACVNEEELNRVFGEAIFPPETTFVLSPEARWLAIGRYSVSNPATRTDIILLDVRNRTLRVLVADERDNRNYSFSPNEEYILYYSHDSDAAAKTNFGEHVQSYSVRMVNVKTGEIRIVMPPPPRETNLFTIDNVVSWSPDSRKVAFVYRVPGLGWQIECYELDSRNVKTLVPQSSFPISLIAFVDGGRVIAAHSRKILLIHEASGGIRELASSEDENKAISKVRIKGDQVTYQVGFDADNVMKTVTIPPSSE